MQASEEALTQFHYGIRNPLTRNRYERRLDIFLKHIGIEGSTLGERAEAFVEKTKLDNMWAGKTVMEYLWFQKERAERGEISYSTLPNYYKPIKLLCEQNDIQLNWKKNHSRVAARKILRGRPDTDDRRDQKTD